MHDSSKNLSAEKPWWLDAEIQCEHCLQHYSRDIRYHCLECDQPVCPLCVVVVQETAEIFCPQCHSPSVRSGA